MGNSAWSEQLMQPENPDRDGLLWSSVTLVGAERQETDGARQKIGVTRLLTAWVPSRLMINHWTAAAYSLSLRLLQKSCLKPPPPSQSSFIFLDNVVISGVPRWPDHCWTVRYRWSASDIMDYCRIDQCYAGCWWKSLTRMSNGAFLSRS